MRLSRILLVAAASATAAFAAVSTTAQAQPAPAASASTQFSDDELRQYGQAIGKVGELVRGLNGAQPTEAQRKDMVDAVTAAGLTPERFNAIATAAQGDALLKARIALASAPPSPAGSVGAGVTDAEAASFAKAMKGIRAVAVSSPPTAEQQTQQQKAVTDSGLSIERFNAISQASSTDLHLRARIAVASEKLG